MPGTDPMDWRGPATLVGDYRCRISARELNDWDVYARKTSEWEEFLRADAQCQGLLALAVSGNVGAHSDFVRARMDLDRALIAMREVGREWHSRFILPRIEAEREIETESAADKEDQ